MEGIIVGIFSAIVGGLVFSLLCTIIILGIGGYKTDDATHAAIITSHIGFALFGMMGGYMLGYGLYESWKMEKNRLEKSI